MCVVPCVCVFCVRCNSENRKLSESLVNAEKLNKETSLELTNVKQELETRNQELQALRESVVEEMSETDSESLCGFTTQYSGSEISVDVDVDVDVDVEQNQSSDNDGSTAVNRADKENKECEEANRGKQIRHGK
jgi:hypothetical protein